MFQKENAMETTTIQLSLCNTVSQVQFCKPIPCLAQILTLSTIYPKQRNQLVDEIVQK